jgi:DNA-binding transcriptional regulator YdaS (Cro superfamily)
MAVLDSVLNFVLPKRKSRAGGELNTPTFQPQNPNLILTLPTYRDHQTDIFTSRASEDSRALIKQLARHDPDVSAAIHGYMTLANTQMIAFARTVEGEVDLEASRKLQKLLTRLAQQVDYTAGYQLRQSIEQQCADMRYLCLIHGGFGAELVFDKAAAPDNVKLIDMTSIRWFERKPGEYAPGQLLPSESEPKEITAAGVFFSFYRRDPTSLYTFSPFVSAINTIAARQQVINDLYRIMNLIGYPRITMKVLEQVLIDRAPPAVKGDPAQLREYIQAQMTALSAQFSNIRVDQAITHSDSIEFSILNEKSAAMSMDISPIISTLDAQNQAALKTMSTMLGRGERGANTGSVEARLAAMFADELNKPLAEMWSRVLSFALHMDGFQGFADVRFSAAELRPDTELEPQRSLKASRLRQDLSDGLISDVEYHLMMYGRLPPAASLPLSGTKFLTPAATAGGVQPEDVSPNTDPVGRSASPDRTQQTRSNAQVRARTPA